MTKTTIQGFAGPVRVGVVSFLNSKPLIEGLTGRPGVSLLFDVPAALPDRLNRGEFDVALVPLIDVIRSEGRLRVVSDACIACDGETMTVRVFSQVPPDRIQTLHVDGDSHTSKALASVLWRELYGRSIELRPFDARTQKVDDCASVLLIGDKVISGRRGGFAYEVDLGAAWRQQTGLPFVFAVWAARSEGSPTAPRGLPHADSRAERRLAGLGALLSAARDEGVSRAQEIAERDGPPRWWPVDLAVRYLTVCLKFRLEPRFVEGADLFAQCCVETGIAPPQARIDWPADVLEACAPAASARQ